MERRLLSAASRSSEILAASWPQNLEDLVASLSRRHRVGSEFVSLEAGPIGPVCGRSKRLVAALRAPFRVAIFTRPD